MYGPFYNFKRATILRWNITGTEYTQQTFFQSWQYKHQKKFLYM